MAHQIDAHGRIVFKRLNAKEQEVTLNYLRGKKLEIIVKAGEFQSKKGNKSGKTIYNVPENVLKEIASKDENLPKRFCCFV